MRASEEHDSDFGAWVIVVLVVELVVVVVVLFFALLKFHPSNHMQSFGIRDQELAINGLVGYAKREEFTFFVKSGFSSKLALDRNFGSSRGEIRNPRGILCIIHILNVSKDGI